eukprot:1189061-Prymnesium_polylepis.2
MLCLQLDFHIILSRLVGCQQRLVIAHSCMESDEDDEEEHTRPLSQADGKDGGSFELELDHVLTVKLISEMRELRVSADASSAGRMWSAAFCSSSSTKAKMRFSSLTLALSSGKTHRLVSSIRLPKNSVSFGRFSLSCMRLAIVWFFDMTLRGQDLRWRQDWRPHMARWFEGGSRTLCVWVVVVVCVCDSRTQLSLTVTSGLSANSGHSANSGPGANSGLVQK